MIEVDVAYAVGEFALDAAFRSGSGVTALFGRSGAGKSTLVELIAGLRKPSAGRIAIDGETLVDVAHGVFLPPHRRRIGLVFQDSALFPHLSVRANLRFGRIFAPRAARLLALDPVVEALGIGSLLTRRPGQLSGGERQRVALARAVLSGARLLLLDEPLAALDGARKQEILGLIERLRDEFRIPIVYVSHSVEEVTRLAATAVVIEAGRVVAIGAPDDVLNHVRALADRFDVVSALRCVAGAHDSAFGLTTLRHPAGDLKVLGEVGPPGRDLRVALRATDLILARDAPSGLSVRSALVGAIAAIDADSGPLAMVRVALAPGETVAVALTRLAVESLDLRVGAPAHVLVKTVALDERPLR
jgi:molybdate transport system ATP-binding protein